MNQANLLNAFIQQLKQKAPRINSLSNEFERIAKGQYLRPLINVNPNHKWLESNSSIKSIYACLLGNIGIFDNHFYASVPYSLENALRLMEAIYCYALANFDKDCPLKFFEPGGASGDMSRTLAKIGDSLIHSLCSSATDANQIEFNKYRTRNSYFYSGPYFEVQQELLKNHSELHIFKSGFDIIFESNTLQMYSKDRENQIKILSDIINKSEGILILEEKLLHDDNSEFIRREQNKDNNFKSNYFTKQQIEKKQEVILDEMKNGMVKLDYLVEAISYSFKHAVLIWNSSNFYDIVASNSPDNIFQFVSLLPVPYIHTDFCHEILPRKLLGLENIFLDFKSI